MSETPHLTLSLNSPHPTTPMPQEPLPTHCLETTALSLLLQNQALGVCGFWSLSAPPPSPSLPYIPTLRLGHFTLSSQPLAPGYKSQVVPFPPVSPADQPLTWQSLLPTSSPASKYQYKTAPYLPGAPSPWESPSLSHLLDAA